MSRPTIDTDLDTILAFGYDDTEFIHDIHILIGEGRVPIAKQQLKALIQRETARARIDELDNLPWKRADKFGINSPYVTKKWLLERKAALTNPDERKTSQ